MSTTGDRIRTARIKRGMTAEDLAKKVGYSTQSGIANLENRATGRGGYKLALIADALGVSLDWLLNGDKIDNFVDMPTLKENDKLPSSNEYHIQEPEAVWCLSSWPFKNITPSQWEQLPLSERSIVERQICGLINSSLKKP